MGGFWTQVHTLLLLLPARKGKPCNEVQSRRLLGGGRREGALLAPEQASVPQEAVGLMGAEGGAGGFKALSGGGVLDSG